jgi:RNA polymerase sigma factor (sigma-70 family)
LEASALRAPVGLNRISLSTPLLRLRSDEQLVALVRAGNRDAFRVIHDRYHQRLLAYSRQMLSGSRQDAEDALQDVFLRAYHALREDDRPIALRGWLYRVAHNRCIDELRRPALIASELDQVFRPPGHDPVAAVERREDLERLVADVSRLPAQQRSALLMRELEGLSYAELGEALGVTVAAIKSLLVRARMGVVEAAEARDVACAQIRRELALAHGRAVRTSGRTRRHLRDCSGCREYRGRMRRLKRSFAAFVPAGAGPLGLLTKLGIGPGSGAAAGGGGAAAGGSVVAGGGLLGGGAAAATTCKVAAVVCSVVVTAGGAVEVERKLSDDGPPSQSVHMAAPESGAAASPQMFEPPRPADYRRPAAKARPAPPRGGSSQRGGLAAAGEPGSEAAAPAPALADTAVEVSPAGGVAAPEDTSARAEPAPSDPTDEEAPAAEELPRDAAPLPGELPPATSDHLVGGARVAEVP